MARSQDQRLTVPVNLKIKQSTLDILAPQGGSISPAAALESRASRILDEIADGAMLVSGQDVQEISTNFGKPVENNRDIVKATEGRASKRDGQTLISFTLDPANESVMTESAEMRGVSLDDHMADVIAMAMDNGWVGETPPVGTRRIFTPELEAWFVKELGYNQFSVDTIKKHIQALKREAKAEELQLTEA